MSRGQIRRIREDTRLAALLAWVAGSVDAIGYLTLSKLFTAHMSGNSAALGAYAGTGEWAQARHRFLPIPFFVLGIALGTFLAELALRQRVRFPFALVLTCQVALLLLFMIWDGGHLQYGRIRAASGWEFILLAALPSVAMGLQNATLRKVGSQSVRTTYVSGMLTNAVEAFVRLLFWLYDRAWGRPPRRVGQVLRVLARQPAAHHIALFGGIWCAFVTGAIMGGYGAQHWELKSLLPLCGLGAIIVVDCVWPIAPTQEPHRNARE